MKNRNGVLVVFMVTLVLCGGSVRAWGAKKSQTTPAAENTGQVEWIKVPAVSLSNSLMGESAQQRIGIYLPASYATSERRYPVLFFLPGYRGDARSVSGWLDIQSVMDKGIKDGTYAEMIIVVVPGMTQLGGGFYVNSPVSGNWEDFVVKDVVNYVDTHYRTLAKSASRGIAGHSMGGYGALNLAMLHPDMFGAVYSLSPGLFDRQGLSNSQMFQSRYVIDYVLNTQKELQGLTGKEGIKAVKKVVSTVFTQEAKKRGYADAEAIIFSLAYGVAFAPASQSGAPFLRYPYSEKNGKLVLDPAVWKLWENGFGGVDEEAKKYKNNWLKLKAVVVDYGKSDEYPWIPQGCAYFREVMQREGIPCEVNSYDGGHDNRIPQRVKDIVLPFFSRVLESK